MERGTENVSCPSYSYDIYSCTERDTDKSCSLCSVIMIKLTFPSNNHVTSGGGSPVMLTSSVSVRPTFTTRFCKLVRSIFGFTERKIGHTYFIPK